MTERRVTRRYIQGFIQVAHEKGLLDQAEQALKNLDRLLKENTELKNLLYHPAISRTRKKSLLQKINGDTAPDIFKRFMDYIIEKKRERILESLYGEFKDAADELRGIVRAKVRSAASITKDQVARLQTELETSLKKQVLFEFETDTTLLGGLQVIIGTHILDGSISGRLFRLHKHLLEEVSSLTTVA